MPFGGPERLQNGAQREQKWSPILFIFDIMWIFVQFWVPRGLRYDFKYIVGPILDPFLIQENINRLLFPPSSTKKVEEIKIF